VRKQILLLVGAALIGTALIGAAATGASVDTRSTSWTWFDHMSGLGHMGFTTGATADQAAPAIEGAFQVNVVGTEFGFAPGVITLAQNEPVNLTFVNNGRISHDLVVPDLDIHLAAGPGREAITGFTPTEIGTYAIVCTLPGHANRGMTATLVVEGSA